MAAISALFYGFRKLSGQSEQTGLGLKQFTDITGLSADQLQRWQQLAMDFGESADEMTGDIKNIQQAMTDTVLQGKFPHYIQAINIALANAGKQQITTDNARDTYGVMDKLRTYARITAGNPDIARTMAQSFHISDKTYGALRTSNFDLNKDFDKSRAYSPGQINTLAKLSVGWTKLFDQIEHALGRLNVKFGPSFLKDMQLLVPEIVRLVTALASLADKMHVIKGLTDFTKQLGDWAKGASDIVGGKKSLKDSLKSIGKDVLNTPLLGAGATDFSSTIWPSLLPSLFSKNEKGETVVNITVHGVEGSAKDIAEEISAHVTQAFRQLPQGGSSGGGH